MLFSCAFVAVDGKYGAAKTRRCECSWELPQVSATTLPEIPPPLRSLMSMRNGFRSGSKHTVPPQ